MDCRTFHKNLEDYLQGGLDFPGRFGMERHAQQCFGCGKDVADAQKLGEAARQMHRCTAPPEFEAAVLNRIQAQGHSHSWRLWGWWSDGGSLLRPLSLGTAGLSLLALGFLISTQYGSRMQQAQPIVSAPQPSTPPMPENTAPAPDLSRPIEFAQPTLAKSDPVIFPRGRRPRSNTVQRDWTAEQGEADYVELLVPGPDNRQIMMRLPKTIRMESGQSSEEYFIRNVSH